MPCEFNLNLSLNSSSFKNDSKGNDGNTNDELAEPSNEEMKKEKNFGGFD